MIPRITPVIALKPISRRHTGGRISTAVALTGLLPLVWSSGTPLRVGHVGRRVRRQVARDRREVRLLLLGPRGEPTLVDDLSGVEHVAVPKAAELGAADIEAPRALRLHVDDVVGARIRVGLHAELVGPE